MYVFQCRYEKEQLLSRTLSLSSLVEAIKREGKHKKVTRFRTQLTSLLPGQTYRFMGNLPVTIVSGKFSVQGEQITLQHYNGWILLEVNHLNDLKEAASIREQAAGMPQTLFACIGSSGRSVKIIVPFILPAGDLPKEDKKIIWFHEHAYQTAVKLYAPWLARPISLKEPVLSRGFRMTYDPQVWYNLQAIPVRMEQPLSAPSGKELQIRPEAPLSVYDRLLPGLERSRQLFRIFSLVLTDTVKTPKSKTENDRNGFLIAIAEKCCSSGISEEDGVQCLLLYQQMKPYAQDIRAVFRSVYLLEKKFGEKVAIPELTSITLQVEEFLNRRYQFRKNRMSGDIEYRDRSLLSFGFEPYGREVRNSICMEAHKEGINCWEKDIDRYIHSNAIPGFHPIEAFLYNLPTWDGKDHIGKLAKRIRCEHPYWVSFFSRWFLSMVAYWLAKDTEHANSTTPLLVGDQGCGKSTFCLHLLPPELRRYYTDGIDFSKRKDVELALHRYALINLDEFDSIRESQQAFLKHILQKASVNMRLPYSSSTQVLRRYATFIATSNTLDLLSDPTGSRRFIGIEIKGRIDTDTPVYYEQLYAQAVEQIEQGERFWYTAEEEKIIMEENERFRQYKLEEYYFSYYFRVPVNEEEGEYLLAIEIIQHIAKKQPDFKYTKKMVLSLGRYLTGLKVPAKRTKRGVFYKVAIHEQKS